MKLSIIIPVYNEENYIDAVIERVRAVPFQPEIELELIAVDDCSTDKTPEHLKVWADKGIVKVFRHDVNKGKARHSTPVSLRRRGTSSWFRTPISSTIRTNSRNFSFRFWMDARTSFSARAQVLSAASATG